MHFPLTTLRRLARPRCGIIALLLVVVPTLWANTPPTVTLVNQDFTVRAGEEVRFAATITGPGTITIQWYLQGAPVEGGNAAELVIPHASASGTGAYQVVAENEFGSTLGGGRVELTVTPAVEFTQQPQSVALRVGETLQLSAQAEGVAVSYHWLRGNLELPAGQDGDLTIPSVSLADAGVYQAVGVGTFGEGRSNRVRVEVWPRIDHDILQLDPEWDFSMERNGASFEAIGALSDGGFVVVGDFSRINGHATHDVAKFTSDGEVDVSFTSQIDIEGLVVGVEEMADGKLVIGGQFTVGTTMGDWTGLVRLRSDGSFDSDFRPLGQEATEIRAMDADGNGRLYFSSSVRDVHGRFWSVRRLDALGGLDTAFVQSGTIPGNAFPLTVAPEGIAYIGSAVGTELRIYAVDETGELIWESSAADFRGITAMDVGPAGRIYAHGPMADSAFAGWRRYEPNGQLDESFSGDGSYFITNDATVLPDGGLAISNSFDLTRVHPDGQSSTILVSEGLSVRSRVMLDAMGRLVYFKSDWTYDDPRLVLRRFETDLATSVMLIDSAQSPGRLGAIVPQDDNQFLVVGDFQSVNGQPRNFAALVTDEGELVEDPLAGAFDGPVLRAEKNGAGDTYFSGWFRQSFGRSVRGLTRIKADGSADQTFASNQNLQGLDDLGESEGFTVLADSSVLAWGYFLVPGEQFNAPTVLRFSESGVLDPVFRGNVRGWTDAIVAGHVVELLDGRLLLAPGFMPVPPYGMLGWLDADGSLGEGRVFIPNNNQNLAAVITDMQDRAWVFGDRLIERFVIGADTSTLNSPASLLELSPESEVKLELLRHADGKLLAFGNMGFQDPGIGTEVREYAARISADGSLDESFEIKGLHEPVDAVLRLEDGQFLLGMPGKLRRTTLPKAPTVAIFTRAQDGVPGDEITLEAQVEGFADSFRWYHNGRLISGSSGPVLELSNVHEDDTGSYQVIAQNAFGLGVSAPATLRIFDPTLNAVGSHYAENPVLQADSSLKFLVHNRIDFRGGPTQAAWSVLLPEGWMLQPVQDSGAATVPPNNAEGLAEWSWSNPATTPIEFSYSLTPDDDEARRGEFAGILSVAREAGPVESMVQPDPLVLRVFDDSQIHAADVDQSRSISLSELLRVIELYNTRSGTSRTGRYRLNARSADGFDADLEDGAFGEVSIFHSADTDDDAAISLSELLRVIELYNTRAGTSRTGAYRTAEESVDGFEPDSD